MSTPPPAADTLHMAEPIYSNLDTDYTNARMRVPGGWLYIFTVFGANGYPASKSVTFVPDLPVRDVAWG